MKLRSALVSLCVPATLFAQATVRVTASNYMFDAPDTIAAGMVKFELVNKGPELHHIQLIRFEGGKTMADFLEAMKSPGIPSFVTFLGGPNAGIPDGATVTTASVGLTPGNYAFVCLVPDAAGVPHLAKGMMRALTVAAKSGVAQAGAPTVDATLTLYDYNFDLDKPLTAGHRLIRVHNTAQQFHEAFLVKLAPGVKLDSLPVWVASGMKGAPPVIPLGGTSAIGPNGDNYVAVDLQAGAYALYCFLPAPDGKEHVAHGMMKAITVQ